MANPPLERGKFTAMLPEGTIGLYSQVRDRPQNIHLSMQRFTFAAHDFLAGEHV